ncbi:hypothetical protein BGZ98_000458, partial [Dissophora globulifera]
PCVVGCNEYFTSAKCPRLKCDTVLQPIENRSRYCPKCKMHLDRDIAAAENIAQVFRAQIDSKQRHSRPAKFMSK